MADARLQVARESTPIVQVGGIFQGRPVRLKFSGNLVRQSKHAAGVGNGPAFAVLAGQVDDLYEGQVHGKESFLSEPSSAPVMISSMAAKLSAVSGLPASSTRFRVESKGVR